ncbi:MAG: ATP-binding cassette domain-containing protein [Parachlamydiaceae bacterium]|nr:ATP-binding cassette domain-containing protein [Parachlamydiaceae bacterium]
MISASNLAMRFGGKILFKQANLQLLPRVHYGLVGPNGSGKSTLIKILIGDVTPEAGDVATPNNIKVGALKQDHYIYENVAIRDVVLMGRPKLWKAMQAKEALFLKDEFTESDCDELAKYEKVIEEEHGYVAESEAAQLLEGLGIATLRHELLLKSLSGGYKLRVLLAQLLFSHPDIMLLDEPTNHLDIYSIRWLEGYLKDFSGTLLLSSHDKEFLNSVSDYIVDLDYGTIKTYKGNYDAFLLAKEEQKLLKENLLAKQDKRKEELMDFVDRFKATASKARQAASKMKQVEKLEDSMDDNSLAPSSRKYPKLRFDICRNSGSTTLSLKGLGKSYGDKRVLKNVEFEVERGERIAFLGVNGIGKSTLLEILTNYAAADEGSFTWGFGSHTAYFPQDHAREASGSITLLDWMGQQDTSASQEKLRGILALVLFSGDDVHKPVKVLSGGETARLILAKMMLIKQNVLIFDEPTNHLDMESIDSLLHALENYAGTILIVSHNRYFISRLATRIIEMSHDGLLDFKCSYEEYMEKRSVDLLNASKAMRNAGGAAEKAQNSSSESSKQNERDNKKIQREKEQLERKIAAAEEKCHRLEKALLEINTLLCSEGYFKKTSDVDQQKTLQKKTSFEADLQIAMAEWERLSDS